MTASATFLSPADAARRLGVSAKALRLYEQHGLLAPARSPAGWRLYGPADMAQAARIVALRGLGLGLAALTRVLHGDAATLQRALAAHQTQLEQRARALVTTIEQVRQARVEPEDAPPALSLSLPWPWGGETFSLRRLTPLHYLVGPLGSGKTRLAMALARQLPDAGFLDLDRQQDSRTQAQWAADPALRQRVDHALAALVAEGAQASDALRALLVALEADTPNVLVVDLVEQGLDHATQQALAAYLRRIARSTRPLFLMTRSSVLLDLDDLGADATIILCPANHSPPMVVAPCPGASGYEAVATCLATPEVRARTQGAWACLPLSQHRGALRS